MVGFDKSITNGSIDEWLPKFFEKLVVGETVEAACGYANNYVKNLYSDDTTQNTIKDACESILDAYYISGNKNNTLFD